MQEDTVSIDSSHLDAPFAPYDLVRTMRASILVLGPLLARGGTAKVSLPGGCAIGARPIDQHLKGFEKMGATISIEHGYVIAKAPLVTSKGVTSEGRETKGSQRKLHGAEIIFDMPTVGGTENLLMAATLAEGQTVLKNVAKEPEIIDLANFLISMGADITGAGSEEIIINGVTELRPAHYEVMADRIEFGTFVIAGAMAGDPLTVVGGNPSDQSALLAKLRESGANIEIEDDKVIISKGKRPTPLSIDTAPYPGFPTDMQAQLMAYLATGTGSSVVSEQIFENRFMHVPELNRLGAHIDITGGKAVVHGVDKLSGTTVMATDLRASASLVLAGLVADGVTTVRRIYHLDRGYEKIGAKLGAVGAKIERFTEGDE